MLDPIDKLHQENIKFLKAQQYAKMNFVPFADQIERWVAGLLREAGHTVEMTRHSDDYDLLVDGLLRVEVKAARCTKAGRSYRYAANVRNTQADLVLLVCVDEEGCRHLFFIPKRDLKRGVLSIWNRCPAAYSGQWARWRNAWQVLHEALANVVDLPRQLELV